MWYPTCWLVYFLIPLEAISNQLFMFDVVRLVVLHRASGRSLRTTLATTQLLCRGYGEDVVLRSNL